MTLASETITRAYRESNLLALSATVTTAQQNEALPLLNTLILSSVGNEAGAELHEITIGGTYDQSQFCSSWVPDNARLILNLTGARTFTLHPHPYSGQRIAIADAKSNLNTYNLTLSGNGRMIEGAATNLILSTNGMSRQWLYRDGNWAKISSLAAGDTMPFPEEFDDYFITGLALRLNPRFAQAFSQESAAALQRQRSQLRARYRRPRQQQELGTLGLMGQRGLSTPSEGYLYR